MGKLRQIRGLVEEALRAPDWPAGLAGLSAVRPKELVGPLFACVLDPDPLTRWRAVTAFGVSMARLAEQNMEEARAVMRQLMWRLNEESGNIAWTVPEVFGEILAQHAGLAREFHRVLASYIHERDCETGDNYLEHCPLRQGVYWGLARLAQVRPELVLPALSDLAKALDSEDPPSRGLGAWALGALLPLAGEAGSSLRARLTGLTEDEALIELYRDQVLGTATVGALAREALSA